MMHTPARREARFCVFALAVIVAGVCACGGQQSSAAAPVEDTPEARANAQIARCHELAQMLAATDSATNGDLRLTTAYAYEDNFGACVDAVLTARDAGAEREMLILGLGLIYVQATHTRLDVAYRDENLELACSLSHDGTALADSLLDDITNIRDAYVLHEYEQMQQLDAMADLESRFFAFTGAHLCTGGEPWLSE